MLMRVLSALLIASATRYGSLPPGSTSSSLASIPRAIDGDIRVMNVTKADDVALRTSIQPIFVGAGTCNTAAADVYVNATTTTNDSVNPFPCAIDGDCLASTARANDVVLRTSTLPIFVGAGTYSGRPPDPGPIPTLNTSMVERFLLELLIYLGFENLRRPLSIHGTIALVCRLWLGISATLLWFFNYCANIVRFVIACTFLVAFRALLATFATVSVVLGLAGYALRLACSLLCCTLCCAVKLTHALGDSIAGIALYMCGLAVAHSAYALACLAKATSRAALSLVYAVTLPMRRVSTAMHERLISHGGGESLELPSCKKQRRKACESARVEALALLARHATAVPIMGRFARLASSVATRAADVCYPTALSCSLRLGRAFLISRGVGSFPQGLRACPPPTRK